VSGQRRRSTGEKRAKNMRREINGNKNKEDKK
jgi:hypothetical protein